MAFSQGVGAKRYVGKDEELIGIGRQQRKILLDGKLKVDPPKA